MMLAHSAQDTLIGHRPLDKFLVVAQLLLLFDGCNIILDIVLSPRLISPLPNSQLQNT